MFQIDDAAMHAATIKCDDAPKQAQEARDAKEKNKCIW